MATHDTYRFQRIPFLTSVIAQTDTERWSADVLELSLTSALVRPSRTGDNVLDPDKPLRITCTLPNSQVRITLEGVIDGTEGENLVIRFTQIDLESLSHLRRMMELHRGSDEPVNRELLESLQRPR